VSGFAQRADALLAAAAPHSLPARDLRLLTLAELGRIDELYDETIVLETLYGGETARTQAMRGVALILQKKYEQSILAFERSLVLRPERHGPHQNLGIAFRHLRRFDEARHHLEQALRLRPFAWNTGQELARVARDRGDFEHAYELAARLPKEGVRHEDSKQPELVGSIALAEAMHWQKEDTVRRTAAAQRAVVAYRESLQARRTSLARQNLAIAEALADDRYTENLVPFARAILDDADEPYQIANLAFLMSREGLDAEQTAWVAAVLRKLAIARAGDEEALKRRLEAEIDEVLDGFR
jgi:tetratricopeptide (TPR) repeat protein